MNEIKLLRESIEALRADIARQREENLAAIRVAIETIAKGFATEAEVIALTARLDAQSEQLIKANEAAADLAASKQEK